MAVKLQHHSFPPSGSSKPYLLHNANGAARVSCTRVSHLDYLLDNRGKSRKRCHAQISFWGCGDHKLRKCPVSFKKLNSTSRKTRRSGYLLPLASADDGATSNGSPSASTWSGVEEMRVKLTQSLQGEDYGDTLVQSLHDAARVVELAIKERGLMLKLSWFSTSWLGVDIKSFVKTLSYQVSVYSLLQAASEISSRGDCRDRDINVFVQRSLSRQSAPLEYLIRDKLSGKQPEVYEWLWSEKVPAVMTSFVNYFEGDDRFSAATAVFERGSSGGSVHGSDISLLLLALTCNAAITKLGPTKVSCPQFFSTSSDITGRLMDRLVDSMHISQAYHYIKGIGLRREFLDHFGPRAAACRVNNDCGSEEVVFWVNLVQQQLQRAIDRDKIWSRLTTSESIEVLEKDLAVFGFFIALGRSTKSFLSANGFDVIDDPIESFIRHLIGGSVLYYPQLSSISSYQLYVEVVCEELDWLPFYSSNIGTAKESQGHKTKREGPPNAEAVFQVLDVCSHWIQSFIKYSKWLETPTNVKAAKFLSRGHAKLTECTEELRVSRIMAESNGSASVGRAASEICSIDDEETKSFDEALESVEEALRRLENLLQEFHVSSSSSSSGTEQLKAACCDLEKIRKLKKEAEFLEASFRAKADSLRQGDEDINSSSSISEQEQFLKEKMRKNANAKVEKSKSKSRGVWNIFGRSPTEKPDPDFADDDCIEQTTSAEESESNEIPRFKQLRNELMELEKRVQRSANQTETEEGIKVGYISGSYHHDGGNAQLAQVQNKKNFIKKSFDSLKQTGTDVLQGTQLLAIDAAAAMELLRRALLGDDLTEKEKKALLRTLTDLASVVPIGILMLLPVTAVGHAAMLAAIQRYVPALIPSTYGPERLDLLRQLEKMKEIETTEEDAEANEEELV